jgi:hypothetical protein
MTAPKLPSPMTAAFVHKLIRIEDHRMRSIQLAHQLKRFPHQQAIDILSEMCQGCWHGHEACKEIFLTFLDQEVVFEILGQELIAAYYRLAREQDLGFVARLFLSLPPWQTCNDEEHPRGQEEITLGEKKALARSPHRATLQTLLSDRDGAVIRILLQNPKITERDVLKIASRRPVQVSILKEIFRAHRWIRRYEVKKAIISNPYAPPGLTFGLIHFLKFQDLEQIHQNTACHPILRAAIFELLNKKRELGRQWESMQS